MSNFNTTTTPSPTPMSWANAFAVFLIMIGSTAGLAEWGRHIATHLDFNNLLNADNGVLLQVALLALSSVPLFLLFQWLVRFLHRQNLGMAYKSAMLLAATFLVYGISILMLPPSAQGQLIWGVGGGLVLAAIFDYATAPRETHYGWTILAFILFSAFSAGVIWTHNAAGRRAERLTYAEGLANARDTAQAEPQFAELALRIQQDQQLPLLLKPWPIKPSADSLRNYLSKLAFEHKYLFRNYDLSIYAFDRNEEAPLLIDQFDPKSKVVNQWNQAQPVASNSALRFGYAPEGTPMYLLQTTVQRMKDPGHLVEIFCFFRQKYPQRSEVYAHIFGHQEFKGMKRLSEYDFALFHQKNQLVEQGFLPAAALQTPAPAPGSHTESNAANRIDALSTGTDGQLTALVGQNAPGVLRPVYLFSILFTIATTGILLLGFLSRFMPFKVTLLPSASGSLRRRIHFSYLALLAVGFMVIGAITFRHFSRTADEARRLQNDARAKAALTYLRLSSGQLTAAAADSVSNQLGPQTASFARSLNVDANLYNADGRLLFATREDLRRIGFLPAALPAEIMTALRQQPDGVKAPMKLAELQFDVRYMPVVNYQRETVAYIGLPEAAHKDAIVPEVSDFIGILASIYVFLLLLAAILTEKVSDTITQPLQAISNKIREVKIDDLNRPLEYDGDQGDEISGLVQEYNQMVGKLETAKVELVKFERESAWKDMARQIAHDIKNPLTTMKLSMQQLERVANDPEQAAAYLKRSTGRLIEQIDSLAQTASEFSMFANLDRTPRFAVPVNPLVESVFDLFSEQKEVKLSLHLPEQTYLVMADKNHLLRVLNNLVINAIQAIPSDTKGEVRVSLERRGDYAVISVRDNGGGIPVEIRDRVFEPNFTTKTTGSGLGLAICKKIIEAHDGDIQFDTQDNAGTEFRVELPIIKE